MAALVISNSAWTNTAVVSWPVVTITSTTPCVFTVSARSSRTLWKDRLPRLKKGETVRVADDLLGGRLGVVQGLLAVRHQWLAFVEWPDGGLATFNEDRLEAVPDDLADQVAG